MSASAEGGPPAGRVHVNQIGYRPEQHKLAVIADPPPDLTAFRIVDEAGRAVFTGPLARHGFDPDSGETVAHADFSAFQAEGRYRVQAGGRVSPPFMIGGRVYDQALRLAARWFYLQRSGADKADPITGFSHRADHVQPAQVWGEPGETREVSGGWWDAGDYGRYVPPAATTLMSLLYAYRFNPQAFADGRLDIPESGDGLPDLLDELRWELTWLLKMQRADGAVHHKATCSGFPGMVPPEAAELPVYVYDVSTWATAQFAGALAEASLAFWLWDKAFAGRLVRAAAQAWRWLTAHPERYPAGGFRNPDASGGPYSLPARDEAEYRLWAAASLFHATGEPDYRQAFEALWRRPAARPVDGLYWWGGRLFAMQAYLDSASADAGRRAEIREAMQAQAEAILGVIERTGYRVALTGAADEFGYDWGSNTLALGYATYLLLVNAFSPSPRLTAGAAAQLNYVLGTNPLGKCYLSGLGANPVRNPHHRPSAALGRALPGMVAEGANAMNIGGDPVLQALAAAGRPFARRYADDAGSWATNEPTLYANAAFVAVAAWFAR